MLSLSAYAANEITTTPNSNAQKGSLPSGYSKITFTLSNGNWVPEIQLPQNPADKAQVNIISYAAYSSTLNTAAVDFPMTQLTINNGDNYLFTYNAQNKKWRIEGTNVSYLTPNSNGAVIANNPKPVSFYSMADANWAAEIKLPAIAKNNDLIIIRSNATWSSAIALDNRLYANTTKINRNDEYVLKYLGDFQRWVVESAPTRTLNASTAINTIPTPTSPITLVKFSDGQWIPNITLPTNPGNRDRVIVQSNATSSSYINNTGVNTIGPMQLRTGDKYEFMYIAENKKWEVMYYPNTVYQAGKLGSGVLPALTTPRTIVDFSDGNYVTQLTLPNNSAPNSRVVVRSNATWTFNVLAGTQRFPVTKGETVAFVVNSSGAWTKETITIDLLLLYSDKAAAKLGESVMQARLREGFSLTNDALENSGANFRYRMVGLKKVVAKSTWLALGDPLRELRDDATVQGWRNELKADGIYYEGTEDGCGLAWLRGSSYNMIASGSTNCGTTVMRHELGHNMSVAHGGESSSYNQGYTALKTIMAGNSIPYYATPKRYSPDYGIPLGIENKIDAVRAMNEFSSTVAAYR
ncbi:hypothetical protein HZU77_003390 [Neisseriaceae bacterium TC5R-5]|nr:hypothetical protein [Neisseriaceae bacterium TC5R-5]